MRHEYPDFGIEVLPARERVIVSVSGELDMATTDRLRAAVGELYEMGFSRLVLDLRTVTFIDSTALEFLLGQHTQAQAGAREFSIAYVNGPVARLLELTGADSRLPRVSDGRSDARDARGVANAWIRELRQPRETG
jgi:anti-anti-sigma factor